MSLLDGLSPKAEPPPAPLAERLRPMTLAEVSGQEHVTGPNGALTRLLAAPSLGSMIFWGPPGSGKTTVARLIGSTRNDTFVQLSAIHTGVAELRKSSTPLGPVVCKGRARSCSSTRSIASTARSRILFCP